MRKQRRNNSGWKYVVFFLGIWFILISLPVTQITTNESTPKINEPKEPDSMTIDTENSKGSQEAQATNQEMEKHVKKCLSDIRSDFLDLVAMANAWSNYTSKLDKQFNMSIIRNTVDKIYSSTVTQDEIQSVIMCCLFYVSSYAEYLYNIDYTGYVFFQEQIEFNVSRLYVAYSLSILQHKNPIISRTVNVNQADPQIISKLTIVNNLIVNFASGYNGYFDKNSFFQQIEDIKEAPNNTELVERVNSLLNCSRLMLIFDKQYATDLWHQVNSELMVLLNYVNSNSNS